MDKEEYLKPQHVEEKSVELSLTGKSNLQESYGHNDLDKLSDSLTEDGIALINDQLIK